MSAASASVRATISVGVPGDVGREPRGDEVADRPRGREQHLAAHVAALLLRRELVLEVHAGGAGGDHRLRQLEHVEVAAEARLAVGDDRDEPVDVVLALGVVDLVGALERGVDPAHDLGHGVDRVEALVGVHLAREVGVGGDLPAAQVDRLEPGAHLLHRLVAGAGAERGDVVALVQQLPQLLGAVAGERVLDRQAAAELLDLLGPIRPLHPLPAVGVVRMVGMGSVVAMQSAYPECSAKDQVRVTELVPAVAGRRARRRRSARSARGRRRPRASAGGWRRARASR